jgi:hypothetical protein
MSRSEKIVLDIEGPIPTDKNGERTVVGPSGIAYYPNSTIKDKIQFSSGK